ncbi:MAG: S8 family serine peptidase [Bacteroidota bacterium]
MKKRLWLVLCGMIGLNTYAQHEIISISSIEKRSRIIGEMPQNPEKEAAEKFALLHDIPIRSIDEKGRIREIRRIDPLNHPVYYTTHNLDAARTVSTDRLWNGAISGLNLKGENILVGVWDGGMVRNTHVEFGSRVRTMNDLYENDGHATHVAGTIGAAGLNPDATGMAGLCSIESYDWNNVDNEMRVAAEAGLLISNHSWGFIHGFDYNSDEDRWDWYGYPDIDEEEDYSFGFYSSDTRAWDDIASDNPFYLIVKSTGNDRLEGPDPGEEHFVWENNDWTSSTEVRSKDGGPDGFDCIGSQATAKNILTVGAVRDIDNGYMAPEDVIMTSYSTFGPTDDGRIKPDIVGNGTSLYSSYSNSDTDYQIRSGTSMAAPNVAGSLVLLQELYFKKFNRFMHSSTLKGVVLHTADEAGQPGPDYKFGWGLLNTYSAAKLISNGSEALIEDSLTNRSIRKYRFYTTEDTIIKVTLCWTDPMGPVIAPSLDPSDLILVNDLDIRLIRRSDETEYLPYVLDPQNPDGQAQTGDNFRDNVEQIYLPVADKGYYDLVVSHKGSSLENSGQHFSLIVEGMKSVFVAEDSTYLDANNGFFQVTEALEYPLDKRFVWLIEPMNQENITLSFTEFNTDRDDSVTIYDGPDNSSPLLGTFYGSLTNPDTLLSSSGRSMFIQFSSGNQEGFKGFAARYCTTPPEEQVVILGEANPCYNSEEIYLIEGHPESNYQWTLSDNIDSIEETQYSISILVPENSFNLTVAAVNECGEGESADRTVAPLNGPPVINPVFTGDTIPCPGVQSLYLVQEDSSASYEWILPTGWRGSSDSSSIWITPEADPGTITVIPWNSCGESEELQLTISPNSLPDPPDILTENLNPCEHSLQEFYFVRNSEDETQWDVETGWEIIGADTLDHVLIKVGAGATGRVFLTSANKCGKSVTSKRYFLTPAPVSPILRTQPSAIEGLDEIVLRNFAFYTEVNWYRNDSIIPDFHEESFILRRNGIYKVEVSNSEGCFATTEESERINVNEESFVYNIFTGSEGVIKVENDTHESATINVYDLTGRTVFSNEVVPGTNMYHTTRRGLLIFRIEGGSYQKTQMVFIH